MKKITIPCIFGDRRAPFDVFIGQTATESFPLEFQAKWLLEQRGGLIPTEVMESFAKLLSLANKNSISFEDLAVYAIEAANEKKKESNHESEKDKFENEKEQNNSTERNFLIDQESQLDLNYLAAVILDTSGDDNLNQAFDTIKSSVLFIKKDSILLDKIENEFLELKISFANNQINPEEFYQIKNKIISELFKIINKMVISEQSKSSGFKTAELIFYVEDDLFATQTISFLQLINNAYKCLSAFLDLDLINIHKTFANTNIVNSYNLEIGRISIASPGIWTFLGSLNPLQQIREFLNDNHERKKDVKYRERFEKKEMDISLLIKREELNSLMIENERKYLENDIIKSKIIMDKIDILKQSGLSQEQINNFIVDFVSRPLFELKQFFDSGTLFGRIDINESDNSNL